MAAALLGDKKPCNLTLHLRRYYDCAWFGQRLYARRSVGCIAVNLARCIDDYQAGFDTDARVERRLARTGILAIDLSKSALDGESRPRCAFSIVLLRHRIAEQCHQPIA